MFFWLMARRVFLSRQGSPVFAKYRTVVAVTLFSSTWIVTTRIKKYSISVDAQYGLTNCCLHTLEQY